MKNEKRKVFKMSRSELKSKFRKKRKSMGEQGITLIALVITIIILLILAGVTLNAAIGENGLFQRAKLATNLYKAKSEKEALGLKIIDVQTGLATGEAFPKEDVGDKLSKMSAINTNWETVTVEGQTYDEGWYLFKKGYSIIGYGELENNWLVNYEKGELIELEENNFIIANPNSSGAINDESLVLNIDPSNLRNQEAWGDTVELKGKDDGENIIGDSELKFDGINDYLKINNVEINKTDGLTMEFYGKKGSKDVYPLEKTYFDGDSFDKVRPTDFRIQIQNTNLVACFGSTPAGSDFTDEEKKTTWLNFKSIYEYKNEDYISMTIDYNNNVVKLYINRREKGRGKL